MSVNLMEGIAISKIVVAVLAIGVYMIFQDEPTTANNSQPTTYRNSIGGKKRSRKNKK